ncbi:MAG: hypothetical protein ABIN74_07175 [Ferruginibacter sp.]
MLTVQEIKQKVGDFPNDKPVEELIDEIILMYKVKQGLEDIKNGNVTDWEDFKKEMDQWLQYK